MGKTKDIDFAKLLGFAAVSDQLSDGVDFRDETISARLGAKVGDPESVSPIGKIDHSRLLGFQTIGDRLSNGIDFQDETFGDKLGAKVGAIETGAVVKPNS